MQIQACVAQGEVRQPILSQVKEKMGGLRIYWREADDAVRELSKEACTQSLQTCEVCGAAGSSLMPDTPLRVRCMAHAAISVNR